MEDYTRPKVTYAVDVLQIAREGIDMQGVSLGDAVQIVDRKLGGLRTTARVLEMTVDELSGKSVALTLGDMREGLSSLFGTISAQLATVRDTVQVMNGGTFATADYLSNLLGRLNTQINGTGGYTYITEGDGIRCYDTAVTDPAVGAEATAVVEIKGGTIRIANTKTAQGAWEWKTVFTSGHIAADLVTAANITAGSIASGDGTSYWNLDNGNMALKGDIEISSGDYLSAIGQFTLHSTSRFVRPGTYYGLMARNASGSKGVYFVPNASFDYLPHTGGQLFGATSSLYIASCLDYNSTSTTERYAAIDIDADNEVCLRWGSDITRASFSLGVGGNTVLAVWKDGKYSTNYVKLKTSNSTYPKDGLWETVGEVDHVGYWHVTGTKSRIVDTDNYGERLLYCYETPSPMFGDIGSGTIDEDGFCHVAIDDIFTETARTDLAYQVFLQKCGEGDLWVSEKRQTHFVVRGTPGLSFDWELKAKQAGFSDLRLEDRALERSTNTERGYDGGVTGAYEEEYGFIGELEGLYGEELQA